MATTGSSSESHLSTWDFLTTKSTDGSRCPIRGLLSFARPLFNPTGSGASPWGWLLLISIGVTVWMTLQLQPY